MCNTGRNLETIEEETQAASHIPVLLDEVIRELNIAPGATVIDGTVGGGGHTAAILAASAPAGRVLGLDADATAIERVSDRLQAEIAAHRLTLVHANFSSLEHLAKLHGFSDVDAILLDLGVSSYQLHEPARGFSFQYDGPLDMRMDTNQNLTADVIINEWAESDIADLLYRFGDERKSRRIARAIKANRPVTGTLELADIVAKALGGRHGGRIHPATRTFQALRIAVNAELTALEDVLPQCLRCLRPGGRMAIISFHSLEDRIVKRWIQKEAAAFVSDPTHPMGGVSKTPILINVTRKPITPTESEQTQNPRSRSAKLRIAQKVV